MEIWKYMLATMDVQQIEIPRGGKILSVGLQRGIICLWGLIDPESPKSSRTFEVIGTGNPIPVLDLRQGRVFLGSVIDGSFVWHVFERIDQ